jgi:hypothetical protein
MRSKDQVLLENAYEEVLNEKGFLPAAVLTAIMAIGGTPKDVNAQDMDRAGIESITNPELSPDGAVEDVMNTLSDRNFPIGKTTKNGVPINDLPENLVKKDTLSKASNSKNFEILQKLTDLIQLKGYKVPPYFKNYRVLKPVGV